MSELVVIENIKAIDVFVDKGLEPYLDQIEREARVQSAALDISTEKGRKDIASLAYKIAKSKTALDELGKELTEDWKAKSKAVDAERKRMRDKMDALKDDIRSPLTEWEDKEKARIERHEADIAELSEAGRYTLEHWQTLPLEAMRDRLKEVQADGAKDWEEFAARGKYAVDTAVVGIQGALAKREAYDTEQAELAKLRQEKLEREQKEREDRIATEAAAKAERDQIEAERKAEADALAKREADKKHRAAINNEALAALVSAGLTAESAKLVIELIAKGQVPHIKIAY